MMENFLTSQQVEEILKVNRITIYRMLQDGRLKGVKIGKHWRFPENQFGKLLTGMDLKSESNIPEPGKKPGFPTHCVQTIQDLYALIGNVGTIVLDLNGIPITELSQPSEYSREIYHNRVGRVLCEEAWKSASLDGLVPGWVSCKLGLRSLRLPLHDEGEVIGFILTGQFIFSGGSAEETIFRIAKDCKLDMTELVKQYQQLPVLDEPIQIQVEAWAEQFIRAVESILQERSGLISRLQRIVQIGTV